jgi:hypothetical protein
MINNLPIGNNYYYCVINTVLNILSILFKIRICIINYDQSISIIVQFICPPTLSK